MHGSTIIPRQAKMQTQMQTRIRIGSPTKRTQAHHAHQPGILKFELSEISDIVIIQLMHL